MFFQCIFGDGVAVFFVITGFFLFENFNYASRLKKTVSRIILPYLLYTVFIFYFYEAFVHNVPIADSLHHSEGDYLSLIKRALTLDVLPPNSGHLWYIITYLLLVIGSPLFCEFAQKASNDGTVARNFVLIVLLLWILNDANYNFTLGVGVPKIGGVFSAAILVIYGNILYKNRQIFRAKWWMIIAPLMFFFCNYMRMKIQLDRYAIDPNNNSLLFWFTTFGIINSTLVAAFCFSFSHVKLIAEKKRLIGILTAIGSYTFPVYLIHLFVRDILFSRGVFAMLSANIGLDNSGYLSTDMLYVIIVVSLVFFISIALCIMYKILKMWLFIIVMNVIERLRCRKC